MYTLFNPYYCYYNCTTKEITCRQMVFFCTHTHTHTQVCTLDGNVGIFVYIIRCLCTQLSILKLLTVIQLFAYFDDMTHFQDQQIHQKYQNSEKI